MSQAELAVGKLLDTFKGQFEAALPRHMRIDHFMRCALTYIKKNPTIGKCSPVSIGKALMDAAQLGLAPDGLLGSAYLVPFNSKDGMQCQLIPGYRGLIDLARRSGEILDIQARPVVRGEDFSIDWGRTPPLSHKPDLDANPAEANGANVRGVYAIAFFKDGSQHLEYMSRSEIEGIQKRSKANGKGFSPWQTDWVEMARKTVVKRLAKYLPLSPELSRAIEIDNDAELVKPADASVADVPATKTAELKNRLAHQPAQNIEEEINDVVADREAAEDNAVPANGNGHTSQPAVNNPESAPPDADPAGGETIEADTLTAKTLVTCGFLGKGAKAKPITKVVANMDVEELRAALAIADEAIAAGKDVARNKGVIDLVDAELSTREEVEA